MRNRGPRRRSGRCVFFGEGGGGTAKGLPGPHHQTMARRASRWGAVWPCDERAPRPPALSLAVVLVVCPV